MVKAASIRTTTADRLLSHVRARPAEREGRLIVLVIMLLLADLLTKSLFWISGRSRAGARVVVRQGRRRPR